MENEKDSDMSTEFRIEQNILEALGCSALLRAYKNVPQNLWSLSEDELEELAAPTKVAHDLRAAFIRVFHQVLTTGRGKVHLTELCKMANCSYAQGHNLLVDRPEVLLWVMRPIGDIPAAEHALIHELVRWMSEIVRRPIDEADGKINFKLADLKIKIFKILGPKIGLPVAPHGAGDPDQKS